jgi:hypothetical protein
MEKQFKIICLVALVLLAIVLPVAAIPAVISQGVSTYDPTNTYLISKTTWNASEAGRAGRDIVVWIRIPPGSDVVNGYTRYGIQYRIFTPDGQDYLKDIWQATGNYYSRSVGYVYPINVGGSKINLSNPVNLFKVEKYYSDATPHEYGGYYGTLQQILPSLISEHLKPYQWAGTWKVEIYIQDNNWDQHLNDGSTKPPESTLVSTQYFTIVDDTGPTPGPSNIPVSVNTTPITPSPTQKIVVEGEKYINADVQKTGAQWDSSEEKCPTWRGTDWSGTGDYYLSHGGDMLTYAINAPATGKYVMWMRDWSDTNHAAGDRQVTIAIDGTTIGTFDAASSFNKGTTGYGWDKFTTVDLGAGSHILTVTKKDTTSSAAIIDELWFSTNVNEIPLGYASHSTEYCSATTPITPVVTQTLSVEGESYISDNVQKTGAQWDSNVEKCPTWRGTDWSGTGDYYLSHGGDTLTYTINAPATGKYVMWMRDWSDTKHAAGDRQVTIAIDGSSIGTYDAASSFNKGTTGYGWDKFTTVDLGAGSHILTVTKKDTTSSAAIIDVLWFSSDLNAVPTGPISHSTALCIQTPTTTWTMVCTRPPCTSGEYITCPQGSTCPGTCGMVCAPLPTTSQSPSPIPMSPVPILGALVVCGIIIAVMKRR